MLLRTAYGRDRPLPENHEIRETLSKFCDMLNASTKELGLKFSLMHAERISEDIRKHCRYNEGDGEAPSRAARTYS